MLFIGARFYSVLPDSQDRVSSPVFEEITSIPFRHSASPTERKHLPETMGSGVAVLDVDGDGRFDVFFVELGQTLKCVGTACTEISGNMAI